MKVAVICANGRAGKLIVSELILRGVDVTAFVRKENRSEAKHAVIKDLYEITYDDLKDFDVVVDAFANFVQVEEYLKTQRHLCGILKDKPQRLIIIGGAGGLFTDKTHTKRVIEQESFPDAYKPISSSQLAAFQDIVDNRTVRWTYVCPPFAFIADGPRTGKYILAGEELTLNSKGESTMSYADFAIGLVDEAIKGNHIYQRISLVSE